LYLKTGGVIRMMLSDDRMQLPLDILDKPILIQVLICLYEVNKLQIATDPFERIFISQKDLKEKCLEYDEDFKEEQLKVWSDEGYLLCNQNEYSYLTGEILLKLYEVSDIDGMSTVEKEAFKNPAGAAGILLEEVLVEGLTVKNNWKLNINEILLSKELDQENEDFITKNCQRFFKPVLKNHEKCGFDCVSWKIKGNNTKKGEITFEWAQIKFGNSSEYISKAKMSILSEKNIQENFQNLLDHLFSVLNEKYEINHKMILITSKIIAKYGVEWEKLKVKFKQNVKYESSIIGLTKDSKELPERVTKWLKKTTVHTFFDHKGSNKESPKRGNEESSKVETSKKIKK